MVHLAGPRTEFWVRRDRQRVPMSHAEIIGAVRTGLEEIQQRREFLRRRLVEFCSQAGRLSLFLAVSPNSGLDTIIVPVRGDAVQSVWGLQS